MTIPDFQAEALNFAKPNELHREVPVGIIRKAIEHGFMLAMAAVRKDLEVATAQSIKERSFNISM